MRLLLLVLFAMLAYFLFWPVAIEPVTWQAPADRGFSGAFEPNDVLAGAQRIEVIGGHGPEDIVVDADGVLYTALAGGEVVKVEKGATVALGQVPGRILGLAMGPRQQLYAADAYRGLLQIDRNSGAARVLLDQVDDEPLVYANNLDVASDGKIYFSEASSKFGARENGGTYPASLLDIMEHGSHGRLLVFDPAAQTVDVIADGFSFANGVALAHDERSVLVAETGNYRVWRVWLEGERRGQKEVLLENLPGFPDNLSRGLDGKYWLGLVSPRNPLLDSLAPHPFWRKVVQRLPQFIRPSATLYGHAVAFDDTGTIRASLQDPGGEVHTVTGVLETRESLYVGSLLNHFIAVVDNRTL